MTDQDLKPLWVPTVAVERLARDTPTSIQREVLHGLCVELLEYRAVAISARMFEESIRALGAIDAALGLPEDGCNSPGRTLAAIASIRAEVRNLHEMLHNVALHQEGRDREKAENPSAHVAAGVTGHD